MAKTVTAAEMKERERAANEAGLLYIQMMENAGRAAYAELKRRVPALRRLLIVAGKGNNGGDGFVMARVAAKEGVQVRVLLAEGSRKRRTRKPISRGSQRQRRRSCATRNRRRSARMRSLTRCTARGFTENCVRAARRRVR